MHRTTSEKSVLAEAVTKEWVEAVDSVEENIPNLDFLGIALFPSRFDRVLLSLPDFRREHEGGIWTLRSSSSIRRILQRRGE
jgi:hypothetical protein